MKHIKVIAFDLDGTLTQHKSPLDPKNREVLEKLSEKYTLLMVGAGQCQRIFDQMGHFPIDIIGNYGMQYARFDKATGELEYVRNDSVPCDDVRSIEERVTKLRHTYGFTDYKGENVQYHPSGCVTFPILGTEADLADKLAFDPDRSKRRAFYDTVVALFPEYVVFVGGSSSFDMAPKPFNKYYALDRYCKENGLNHDQVVYVGDDYGQGGNDASVYHSDFTFVTIDDYRTFPEKMEAYL